MCAVIVEMQRAGIEKRDVFLQIPVRLPKYAECKKGVADI